MKTPGAWLSEMRHNTDFALLEVIGAIQADARRAALESVMGEVEEMETQAEVDEAQGGECNRCAARALREYAGHIRALLDSDGERR